MQNNVTMQKYRKHPFAQIIVLGYASKDGDTRNKYFALNRAHSVENSVQRQRGATGFDGRTFSWCVGETEILSQEINQQQPQHNRAAEVWLIVSQSGIYSNIKSDRFN